MMLQASQPDDYVIATGQTYTVREFRDEAFSQLPTGIQFNWGDARYTRPSEVDTLCGDPTKARDKLGWHPTTSFEELVRGMVEHDTELAAREAQGREVR